MSPLYDEYKNAYTFELRSKGLLMAGFKRKSYALSRGAVT